MMKRFARIPTSLYIMTVAAIALVARLLYIAKASIWHDEGYSAMIINQAPADIITTTANDVHPPLYYLLLHAWQTLFGPSVISLRGFSAVCGVLLVILLYVLLRRLLPEATARLGMLLAAVGPFLVRYSDEARMYSLAALIAVAATYALVRILENHRQWGWWLAYGTLIALGMYTQYFVVLLVPVHMLYAWVRSGGRLRDAKTLLTARWLWWSGAVAVLLFLPWLPTLVAQFTRVNAGFWIPPVDLWSIPHTLSMFLTYNHDITHWFGLTFAGGLLLIGVMFYKKQPKLRATSVLLIGWTFLPMIIIAILSLQRPVYMDRYFVFTAPAFYALLAFYMHQIPAMQRLWKAAAIGIVLALCVMGIANVGRAATHQMSGAGELVSQLYKPTDMIVSAELYTYFDFSYYNHTGAPVHLLSKDSFGTYGEWSLLRGKDHLRIKSLDSITAPRIWLVGKTGEHDYFTRDIPQTWRLLTEFSGGDSVVKLYEAR